MEAPAAARAGDKPAGATPRLGPVRRGVREIGLALITLGVIVFLFVAYQLWGTSIAEAHHQAALKREFNAAIAASQTAKNGATDRATVGGATAPASPSPALGSAIAHLVIPKIHLDKYVIQGIGESDLQQGPGHYPQTVMPGQDGNAAIAGHRTTYGAPFFDLDKLAVGDTISLTNTADQTFVYRVSERPFVVSPSDVAVLDPTPFAQLTLTTCNPRFSDTSRLIVVARLTNRPALPGPQPTPSSGAATGVHPAAAATVNSLGSGTSSGWPPALAYGAAVVVLWVGTRLLINRTRRWARVGAYVGGIAICLVPLWFCFENVGRILPQNI
jgi:sortase A